MCRSVASASARSPRPNPSIGPGPDRRAAKTERTDRTHGADVAGRWARRHRTPPLRASGGSGDPSPPEMDRSYEKRQSASSSASHAQRADADVSTTMIYTHVLTRGGLGVKSPIDRL